MFSRHLFAATLLLAGLFLGGVPMSAHAASLELGTDKETFVIGDTFTITMRIVSPDVGINAAQATLSYPQDTVQLQSVDTGSSIFHFWLKGPEFSNDAGTLSFIGGTQSGVSGQNLEVLRATFKVKGAGPVNFAFSDGAVTASDGSGTNVLSAMRGLQLTSITTQDAALIKPPQIVRPAVPSGTLPSKPEILVPLYPDSTAWYAHVSKFIAHWELPNDVTVVATKVTREPNTNPTASTGLFDNEIFPPLDDGIWYLHVRYKNALGWGPTEHYRIRIDTDPPSDLSVESQEGSVTEHAAPTLFFSAKDQPSGIRDYAVWVDGVLATTTTETAYTLEPQAPGKRDIVVKAADEAGNITEGRLSIQIQELPLAVIAGIRITQVGFFTTIIVALLVGIGLGVYAARAAKRRRRNRIVIAQRDVQTSFNLIRKETRDFLAGEHMKAPDSAEAKKMKALLGHVNEILDRFEKYMVQNIEEIEE